MDYLQFNKKFWNNSSIEKGPWSEPFSKERIEKAKSGVQKDIPPYPESWFPESLTGLNVLGVAAGGGQAMPLISAMGAKVTSFDVSEEQLKKDEEACHSAGLKIRICQGHMEDLSLFEKESFDWVLNGISSCWIKNVQKAYKEIFRVLKPEGVFITGFSNPLIYSLDWTTYKEKREMRMIHKIPYSDESSLSDKERKALLEGKRGIEFSHSLEHLIGGQGLQGFKVVRLLEKKWKDISMDYFGENRFDEPIDNIMPSFIFTKAIK